jgi:hypothetical protein
MVIKSSAGEAALLAAVLHVPLVKFQVGRAIPRLHQSYFGLK